jgi:phosphoesterase RecJ-like protein
VSNLEQLARTLRGGAPVLILSHVNPDGDSVGASIGLALWLRRAGVDAGVHFDDGLPSGFEFLPGGECVRSTLPKDPSELIVVVLDTPDPSRTGKPGAYFERAAHVVNIDHHPSNSLFGDVKLVDVDASSTALLVYEIISAVGEDVGADVATALYTGVLTDTGGFRFGNTDARTLEAAAGLARAGADVPDVARRVYGEQPLGNLRLVGMVLESLESFLGGRVAVMVLTDEMRERAGVSGEDIEGLGSYGHLLEGVDVSLLLREQGPKVRVSLRSSGRTDVNAIAKRLGGGGHKAAAGVLLDGPLARAREDLVEAVQQELAQG